MCNYNPINSHSHKHAVCGHMQNHMDAEVRKAAARYIHTEQNSKNSSVHAISDTCTCCVHEQKGQWHAQGQSMTILLGVPLSPEVVITTKRTHTQSASVSV